MSKAAYMGVGGTAHKVKKMYIGVNGVARKVKKAYIGVNGVARLFFADSIKVAGVHNLLLAANAMGSAWNSNYCFFNYGWVADGGADSSISVQSNWYDTNLTYGTNNNTSTHNNHYFNGKFGGRCGISGSSEEYAVFGEGDSVTSINLIDNSLSSSNLWIRYRSPEGLGYYGFTSWNNEFWQIGGSHGNRGYSFWYHIGGKNSYGECGPGNWLDNSAVAGNGNYLIVAGGHGSNSGNDDGYGSWTSYKAWSVNKSYTLTQLTDYPAVLTGYRGSNGNNYCIFPVVGQNYAYAYDNNLTLHQIAAVPNPGARAISYKNMHLWPAEGTYMRWYDDNTLTLHSLEDLDTSVWGGVATGIVGTYLLIAGGYRYDSNTNTNIRSNLVQAYNLEGLS